MRYVYVMLKKLSLILAGCAISVLFALTASADTISIGKVNADALNVRAMPSTSASILGLLPTNHEVTIIGQEGNWYKISYGGGSAYVSADYIIVTQSNIPVVAPAPVVQPTAADTQPVVASPAPVILPPAGAVVPSYAGSAVPGEQLVELAKLYIGTPYVYGGMSPAGFDCSGFVKYCYSLMGVELNRIAADQALNGIEVPLSDIKPGDILCFASSVGGSYIGHTGIYVGDGYFIHSPRTGYNVEIVPLETTSYGMRILNIRRIF